VNLALLPQPPWTAKSSTAPHNVRDVLVRDSVFWNAEAGNALEIGFELRAEEVSGITWRNCDVIHVDKGAVLRAPKKSGSSAFRVGRD